MRKLSLLLVSLFVSMVSFGQRQQFEESKVNYNSDSLKVKIGGALSLQYQAIKCKADSPLVPLGNGINLPEANLNIDAWLAKGIKVNLVAYLSSKHHNESWVKGGYLLVDDLSFLHLAPVDELMKNLTIKVGVMELDYGDQHFRRSDNGNNINNPFVGNYIMDPFTTASALELLYRHQSGFFGMLGTTNGIVNQQIVSYNSANKQFYTYNFGDEEAFYGKIGYDKKINSDLRVRASLSLYNQDCSHQGTLYGGDRSGSRYYLVMIKRTIPSGNANDVSITSNAFTGNFGPGSFHNDMSGLLNLFIKYKGIEFFGHFEQAIGITAYTPKLTNGQGYKFNQIGTELVYRFGKDEQFYAGGKYNTVKAHWDPIAPSTVAIPDQTVNRYSGVIGWYLNKYTIAKVEYVDQEYNKFDSTFGKTANFKGIMVEAGISF